MKKSHLLGALSAVLFTFNTTSSVAAIISYTDKGLDFVINDDDPFAPTIAFSDVLFPTPIPTSPTVSFDKFSGFEVIPQPFPSPPLTANKFNTVTGTITSVSTTGNLTATAGQASTLSFLSTDTFGFNTTFSIPTLSILVSGVWSVEGDTEVVNGVFSEQINNLKVFSMPSMINTSQYPSNVSLDQPLLYLGTHEHSPIITTVDGSPFQFTLAVNYFDHNLSITEAPIPAALWLFGSGLLGLVGVARRKA